MALEPMEPMDEREMKEGYDFLFRKVMEEKKAGFSSLAVSFRESAFQNGRIQTPNDEFALDMLCYFAYSNEKTPFKGRACALEALSLLSKARKRFSFEEALSCYELLLLSFNELEDVRNERSCAESAAYYASRLGKKEDAYLYEKRNIDLCFRFEEEERKKFFPNYESLVLLLGKEKAKELVSYIEEGPTLLYDPIETNPFFLKVLPTVNEKLKDYFTERPKEFCLSAYNEKKKAFLREEGFEWEPPHKANR